MQSEKLPIELKINFRLPYAFNKSQLQSMNKTKLSIDFHNSSSSVLFCSGGKFSEISKYKLYRKYVSPAPFLSQ